MAPQSAFDTHIVEQKVKTLVNAQLKSILKRENLLVSGLKAAMQRRITDRKLGWFFSSRRFPQHHGPELIKRLSLAELQLHANNQDPDRFNRLKGFIMNPDSMNSTAPPYSSNQIPYTNFPPVAGRHPDPPPLMLPGSSGTCTYLHTHPSTNFR